MGDCRKSFSKKKKEHTFKNQFCCADYLFSHISFSLKSIMKGIIRSIKFYIYQKSTYRSNNMNLNEIYQTFKALTKPKD
ncbi:hypothetical protein BpHYR1_010596 [Brachionus plicatilis]|uniref:Uncharacterized protein n=1 Tax=Brachionus plicatilis TaxID=10195 RepID=A0A3M7PQG9_BRAPC|nr:hypothetical protein BpHYR1_010596 [Brachionus plicatilis]